MTTTTKTARLCLLIIAIIALAGIAQAQKMPKAKPPKAEHKAEEVAVPAQPQTPEQVDAFMGSSDRREGAAGAGPGAQASDGGQGRLGRGRGGHQGQGKRAGAFFLPDGRQRLGADEKAVRDLHRRGGRIRRPGRCLAQADRRQGHRPLPADPARASCDRGGGVCSRDGFFSGRPGTSANGC